VLVPSTNLETDLEASFPVAWAVCAVGVMSREQIWSVS
jgi:hypothetical protein